MNTKYWGLQARDFLRGFIMFVGTPVLYYLQEIIPGWNIDPMAKIAISAACTYLLKNLFTDTEKSARRVLKKAQQKREQKQAIEGA